MMGIESSAATPIAGLWSEYQNAAARITSLEAELGPANARAIELTPPPPASIRAGVGFDRIEHVETHFSGSGPDVPWISAAGWHEVAARASNAEAAARAGARAAVASEYEAAVERAAVTSGTVRIDAELEALECARTGIAARIMQQPSTCLGDLRIQCDVGAEQSRNIGPWCEFRASIAALAAGPPLA